MNCPSIVADAVILIIQTGILRTRSAAWAGDVDRCGIEADHVHNLASILLDYHPDTLRFCLETERVLYKKQVGQEQCQTFLEAWNTLDNYLAEHPSHN